jgi:hypothetical protein
MIEDNFQQLGDIAAGIVAGLKPTRADVPSEWFWWERALESGKPAETEVGNPRSGFWRVRDRNADRSLRWDAVAIWREDGEVYCSRTGPRPAPEGIDAIDELFAYCAANPISHELYIAIENGEAWPEDVAPATEAPVALLPHEEVADALAKQQLAAKAWFTVLGHKPASQGEADKAANFGTEFDKIRKKAVALHTIEKEPFLAGGREVDSRYFPTRDAAIIAAKWAKGLSDDYVKAENARRAEEARIANEAARKRADGALPEPKTIVAEPVRVGTAGRRQSLRTIETWELESIGQLLLFLSERNHFSQDLVDAATREGRSLAKSGADVPGMKKVITEEVR